MNNAIVVGSGLAGLTAAYRLKQAGWQVTVLEQSDYSGGRVITVEKRGYLVDVFASAFSEAYVDFIELLRDLGLGDRLVTSSNIFGVARGGVVHYVDGQKPVSSFLSTKLMSWPEKVRFVVGALKLKKYMAGVSIAEPGASVAYDHLTINDIMQRCFGAEFTDNVVDPMLRLVTFGNFRETSAVELLTGLVSASARYVNLTGGVAMLPLTMASHVDVKLNSTVREIKKHHDKVDVTYDDHTAGGTPTSITVDACVIACRFPEAVALYPQLGIEAPLLAAQTKFAPSIAAHLGYAAPTKMKPVVVALPRAEFPYHAAIFVDHTKAPDRAPPGHSLFTLYYTPEMLPTMKDWSEQRVVEHACSVIEQFFPELKGRLDMSDIRPAPYTCHLAPTGYFNAVQEFFRNHASDDPIQLAGDYFSLPSQEAAVAWGNRAARRIIQAKSRG